MKNALAGVVLGAALAAAGGGASGQQFTMKMSSPTAKDVSTEWMATVKKGIESRSGGKIKVELYLANQLGQLPATVEGVALGTIELNLPAVGFLVGLEPRFEVFDIPGIFDSVPHAMQVLTDPEIHKRLSGFGAAKGIEPLSTYVNGPMMLLSHKPVRSLADFKGQKIRAPGGAPIQMDPLRRLGALPLSMGLGEVLPAMQNRAIDGTFAAFVVFTSFKYYDVAKTLTALPNSFLVASAVVNRNWLKSLGPDLEAVVREECRKADVLFSTKGVEDLNEVAKTWQQNGGQIVNLPPADAKRYVSEAVAAAEPILKSHPQVKQDYDALLAAAKKYRK